MTYNYVLSLGSNIEPRLRYLKLALRSLSRIGNILQKSSIMKHNRGAIKNRKNFTIVPLNLKQNWLRRKC